MTNQNDRANGKKKVDDNEATVKEMQRSNDKLMSDPSFPRASSSHTPPSESSIMKGGLWFFDTPPTKGMPTPKPVVELPNRLEDIERVATEDVELIEDYAQRLVARAKLEAAQEQRRKAKKNRKKAIEMQDWSFWRNQEKLYEESEREAEVKLQELGASITIGRTGSRVLQASARAIASFSIKPTSLKGMEKGYPNSQLVEHFKRELGLSLDNTPSAEFLKDLEESISTTLLGAYSQAHREYQEEWGTEPKEPIHSVTPERKGKTRAPSVEYTPNKRVKCSKEWLDKMRATEVVLPSESEKEESDEDPDELSEEEDEVEKKKDDDPEYTPEDYPEDDD